MARKAKLDPVRLSIGQEDIADAGKVNAAAVTKADFVREFGEESVRTLPNGDWEGQLRTFRDMKKFDEMDQARVRADVARSGRQNAEVRDVVLRDREGRTMTVPEHHARNKAIVMGLTEAPRYGRATRHLDARGRWWRRVNGKWVPE